MYAHVPEKSCAPYVDPKVLSGVGSPGTRVTDGSEPSDMGSGNRTKALWQEQ